LVVKAPGALVSGSDQYRQEWRFVVAIFRRPRIERLPPTDEELAASRPWLILGATDHDRPPWIHARM
jgi:hypothetical protein